MKPVGVNTFLPTTGSPAVMPSPFLPAAGAPSGGGGSGPDVDVASPLAGFGPGAYGLLTWTFDEALQGANSQTITAGKLYAEAVPVASAITVRSVVLMKTSAGSAATHAYIGLYDSAGNLLGQTGDLAASWNAGAGPSVDQSYDLTAPATITPTSATDWVHAVLLHVSGISPAFISTNTNGSTYTNLSTGPRRSGYLTDSGGVDLTGQTVLPASINPHQIDGTANMLWVAFK